MRIKVKNINHMNDILFYGGFDQSQDLVVIMNKNTLNKFTREFNKELYEKSHIRDLKWEDPEWFAQYNGVLIAIGNWLEDNEVDIKL